MTISGVIFALSMCLLFGLCVVLIGYALQIKPIIILVVDVLLAAAIWGGTYWYFNCTASGRREVVDEYAELNNGLNRTINIYTANGDLIATYTGKIDLEDNDGGYVLFDYEGKRYTYYNCFVESIANID